MAAHLPPGIFRTLTDERLNFDTERPLVPLFHSVDHLFSFVYFRLSFPTVHRPTLVQYILHGFSQLAASTKTLPIPPSDPCMRIPLQLTRNPRPVRDIARRQSLFN